MVIDDSRARFAYVTGELIRARKLTGLNLAQGLQYVVAATVPGVIFKRTGDANRTFRLRIAYHRTKYLWIQFKCNVDLNTTTKYVEVKVGATTSTTLVGNAPAATLTAGEAYHVCLKLAATGVVAYIYLDLVHHGTSATDGLYDIIVTALDTPVLPIPVGTGDDKTTPDQILEEA